MRRIKLIATAIHDLHKLTIPGFWKTRSLRLAYIFAFRVTLNFLSVFAFVDKSQPQILTPSLRLNSPSGTAMGFGNDRRSNKHLTASNTRVNSSTRVYQLAPWLVDRLQW